MTKEERRRRDLAMIHMGAKQIGLNKDDGNKEKGILSTYHAMLWTVAQVKSSADLDQYGRRKVIQYLKQSGADVAIKNLQARTTPAADKEGLVKKINAQLAEADKPTEYADGIAKHMYKVDRFEWCSVEQLKGIVAALYRNANRKGLRKR